MSDKTLDKMIWFTVVQSMICAVSTLLGEPSIFVGGSNPILRGSKLSDIVLWILSKGGRRIF